MLAAITISVVVWLVIVTDVMIEDPAWEMYTRLSKRMEALREDYRRLEDHVLYLEKQLEDRHEDPYRK